MTEQDPFIGLPSIDKDVMQPLKDLLGDNFNELVNDFLDGFPSKFSDLKTASNSTDINGIMQISHTLKSSSGSFGFTCLFKRLEQLELQARNNHVINHLNQVKLIEKEFKNVLKLMERN